MGCVLERAGEARGAISLALVCLAVVACDGTGAVGRGAFGSCPRQFPRLGRPLGTADGKVVALDPVAGQVCVYSSDRGAPTPLRFSALLGRAQARTLALLLDRRGGHEFSCDGGHPVLLRLRYPAAAVLPVMAAGCEPELVSTPSGIELLSPNASLAVAGLIDPPPSPGERGTPVLDYVGRSLAAAGRSGGTPISELIDPGAPSGQVVWQIPLPATERGGGPGAELIIAVHSEPACRADQLAGRYQTGEAPNGAVTIGDIELIDTSTRACSLQGSITLHGIARDGRADTETVSEPIEPPLILSPRTTLHTLEREPAAALIASLSFAGTGPDAIICRPRTMPAAWSLTFSRRGTLRIPAGRPGDLGPFSTCRGNLASSSFLGPADVRLLGSW